MKLWIFFPWLFLAYIFSRNNVQVLGVWRLARGRVWWGFSSYRFHGTLLLLHHLFDSIDLDLNNLYITSFIRANAAFGEFSIRKGRC